MSSGWGYWAKLSNWRNNFGSTGYAYIDLDGATNRTLSQTVTGLSNNSTPYILEFDIWSNNFNDELGRTGTTATLVFSLGGTTYTTFFNTTAANGNVNVSTSNGATSSVSSFPVTLIADEAWTHVTINFNYSGPVNGNLQFSFSSSPPDGDDFAIDNVTLCNNCPYEVTDNFIEADQTVCSGTSASTITGSVANFNGSPSQTYQWQVSSTPTGPWSDIPGATGQNYNPGIVTSTKYYRRLAKSSCFTNSDSEVVAINVASKPFAGNDASISCPGNNSTYNLIGTPSTGTWSEKSGNPTGITLGGTTSGQATVTFSGNASGIYQFIYTSPNSCSDTIAITYDPCILISGNIFNDNDGLVDNTVDGPLIASLLGTTLYVNIIDNTTGLVVDYVEVSSTGAFTSYATKNKNYTIQISTNQGVKGSIPPVQSLPSGWTYTGENIGTSSGNDGTVNGSQAVIIGTSNISNINFGIERLPESDNLSTTIVQPTIDQFITLNGGTNPPILNGSDPEDGAKGTGSTVIITSLTTNGELYYNGSLVSINQVITNFNPSLLQFKATGSGYTSTTFEYAFVDDANKQDPTPATYTLNWASPLPVDLISFTANATKAKTVELEFTTTNEINLSHYSIERNVNDNIWSEIGRINSKNAISLSKYNFTDYNPAEENLYRIKIVNKDNSNEYSNVKKVNLSFIGKVNMFPNPAHSSLNLTEVKPDSRLEIIAADGRMITQMTILNSFHSVDVSKFAKGIYTVKLSQNGKIYFSEKFSKE